MAPLLLLLLLLPALRADPLGDWRRRLDHLLDPSAGLPFRNVSLPWAKRVADLVGRLNTSEVIAQLRRGGAKKNGPAPAIPRLGVAPYNWNTECLRGVGQAGPATSFPQAIGLAASFDRGLLWRVANATGAEARAKHIENSARGRYGDHTGMSCFAPVVNIMRHPLWGRNQETYGEDPFHASEMARAFVNGLQGNRSARYLQASATCKHFAAYSGPENIPVTRFVFNAVVSPRDLALTFLPAFNACVAAGARGVMCSYNSVNGEPACAHRRLLIDVLRRAWRFPGYVVSDEGALRYMIEYHHAFSDPVVAAAAAVNAGVSLDLADDRPWQSFALLPAALRRGLVSEAWLRRLAAPLFETRMRLGEFDPARLNPYAAYRARDLVQSAAHRRLSLEAALRSFVLLKHRDAFLPWAPHSSATAGLALVGPFGRNMTQLYGDYAADRMPRFETTLEAGLRSVAAVGAQLDGCRDGPRCTQYDAAAVRAVAARAKLLVLALGTGQVVEAEARDRVSLALPGRQPQLLADVLRLSPPSARVLLLLFSASPLAIADAVASSKVKAVLWCGFPAQTAGAAVAAALTPGGAGQVAGRLPFTWYADAGQLPGRTDYRMHNQTYRYLPPTARPQFPFGFGLSLARFAYDNLTVPARVGRLAPLRVTVRLRNVGRRPGQEVVQVYIRWPSSEAEMPRLQLAGVHRTGTLQPGQSQRLSFSVSAEQRRVWRSPGGLRTFVGRLSVFVGGQQPGQKVRVPSNVLSGACYVM